MLIKWSVWGISGGFGAKDILTWTACMSAEQKNFAEWLIHTSGINLFQISAVCIFLPFCCSWACDFPAAEYPAAGWTEFTQFAYQPRNTLSRRVWGEAIEGPTGQVIDFWSVIPVGNPCDPDIYSYTISFRNILSWSHCLQGLSFITKINLKIGVELRCKRSEGWDWVGPLITLLQETSVFGDSWETPWIDAMKVL